MSGSARGRGRSSPKDGRAGGSRPPSVSPKGDQAKTADEPIGDDVTDADQNAQMIRAVRAYQEGLYARQHRLWARFLLRRWWSWVNRTSEWWRRCNQRELEREWIYD